VFLTAGHCTYYFTAIKAEYVVVSFDPRVTSTSTFYTSHEWYTHPDYVDADWPYTQDFGIVILDQPVYLDQYGVLPEVGLLDELIPATGQTQQRFTDVGYGQTGVQVGGGPPQANFPLERRQAVQRYAPGGEGGIGHGLTDLFLFLQNVPSEPHGSACGGDSGSPVFLGDTNQLVAVHTGGYRLGPGGVICGRLTSLNHRLDTEVALDWINGFL
jgi:secreted trypsin-like serine protease